MISWMCRDGSSLAGTSKGDIVITVGNSITQIVKAPPHGLSAWGSTESHMLEVAPKGILGTNPVSRQHLYLLL